MIKANITNADTDMQVIVHEDLLIEEKEAREQRAWNLLAEY